jgi:hypothetical protein
MPLESIMDAHKIQGGTSATPRILKCWTDEMSQESEIQNGLENISGRSRGKIRLKTKKDPRISKRACRIRFDFDGVPRKLLEVRNTFVR